MNESETHLDVAPETTIHALEEEVQSLRTLFICTLLVLIVLSAALNIFLLRQASLAGTQAAEQQKAVDQYNNVNAPVAREMWVQLLKYAEKHPDFKSSIIAKYSPYLGMPAPSSTPPPAAGAPKK